MTRLTDATVVHPLPSGKHVAVFEGTGPATVLKLDAPNVFPCAWLVPVNTEDGPSAVDCGAPAVGFDNGWTCAHGHIHYMYGWEGD